MTARPPVMRPPDMVAVMKTATFVLAVLGSVLGIVSLGWQITSWRLSGARVRLRLEIVEHGDHRGRIASPLDEKPSPIEVFRYAKLTVWSTGRASVSIDAIELTHTSAGPTDFDPVPGRSERLPHRLEAHSSAVWEFDVSAIEAAKSIESGSGYYFATVTRGNGRISTSPKAR